MKLLRAFLFFLIPLVPLAQDLQTIAKMGINATVSVIALDAIGQPLSYGSGFIVDDGLIVTNVHVMEGSQTAYILKSNEASKYKVEGYLSIDKRNDLILLKAVGLNGDKLTIAAIELPSIGERIYAVGNPKGLTGTFSEGIVSGIRGEEPNRLLQITAPISPGSSGGPVLNSVGQLVGVAVASYAEGQNLNFAIPSVYVKNLLSKASTIQAISLVKPPPKSTNQRPSASNIKEGVIVRNINLLNGKYIEFSVKNNLSFRVADVRLLFLVYDKSGTVVDYTERTYFEFAGGSDDGIKPYLAKSIDFFSYPPEVNASSGSYVRARVLDFRIIED